MVRMDPQSSEIRTYVDSNIYGQFRLPIGGKETATVRSISAGTIPLLVEISLSQVTLYGPMPAIRERLTAMIGLLDRVVAEPERWNDITPTEIGPHRWQLLTPHPSTDPSLPTTCRRARSRSGGHTRDGDLDAFVLPPQREDDVEASQDADVGWDGVGRGIDDDS